ncbi:hypothetical protein Oter_2598 [Opitutus terrae PB90-1]|uniref:Peptidase S49 domain-containing protein n=2 Tax=Opitutus terrae TaxID=107709 RepID=B1ZTZ8_OPITP|nr:hypothetical protein Oter_2598 [Opitutus terrae PB90-1]
MFVCGTSMLCAQDPAPSSIFTIPIKGSVTEQRGREIVAQIKGVPASVRTIAVFVDSDGGALPDILAVADALSGARVTTVAYVKNAVASAVFIVASCDRVVSDRAALLGGAGVVSRDFLCLSDSLFSAVREELTVKLRRYSEQKHHDSDIFGAMLDHQSSLIRGGRQWKARGEILSLTADEMVALGVAESRWDSLQAFIADLTQTPNQTPQRNAGSRPSSGDSPVSETPSSLGPRG